MRLKKLLQHLKGLGEDIAKSYAVDVRALGLFRIGLGSILLLYFSYYLKNAEAFVSDDGLLTLSAVDSLFDRWDTVSLFWLSGSDVLVYSILLVGILCSISFIIGFKTRLTSVLLWIIVISIINRNVLAINVSDNILRIVLFWSMFLPLGKAFAIDTKRKIGDVNKISSIWITGFIMQIAVIWGFSVLHKIGSDWLTDFSAAYYALHLEIITTSFGQWFHQFETLLEIGTVLVLLGEAIIPILLVLPLAAKYRRIIGLVALSSFGVLVLVFLSFGLLPFIFFSVAILFLPGRVLDTIDHKMIRLKIGNTLHDRFSLPKIGVPSSFTNMLGVSLMGLVLLINIDSVSNSIEIEHVQSAAMFIRIDQKWDMFAPNVQRVEGWFITEVTIGGEKKIIETYFSEGSAERPEDLGAVFSSVRYRKFMFSLYYLHEEGKLSEELKESFGQYVCKVYGDITEVRLTMNTFQSLPNYMESDVESIILLEHTCE